MKVKASLLKALVTFFSRLSCVGRKHFRLATIVNSFSPDLVIGIESESRNDGIADTVENQVDQIYPKQGANQILAKSRYDDTCDRQPDKKDTGIDEGDSLGNPLTLFLLFSGDNNHT